MYQDPDVKLEPSLVKSPNSGASSGKLLLCHIPGDTSLQKYGCTAPNYNRNDSPWKWLFSHSSCCLRQLGLLWCDGFTTLFNCNQTAWGNKLSSFPTRSFLHPCSLSTLTKHVSVEHLCSEAHRRGISCSFCWYSSAAIADIFLSQQILQSWVAECCHEHCWLSSLSQPSFLRQTFFAGSFFSTWDDQVAMTVLPGGLQWTSEQPHKPLHHCPRRKCVQAPECGPSCRWEGCLCEGSGSYICFV